MAKMNKAVVRRMIERIGRKPRGYDQGAMYVEPDDTSPCGTVACLAGEAVICSVPDEAKGIRLAHRLLNGRGLPLITKAEMVLGLVGGHAVFAANVQGWPEPYRSQFNRTGSRARRAAIAVTYLKEALQRGTMEWGEEAL